MESRLRKPHARLPQYVAGRAEQLALRRFKSYFERIGWTSDGTRQDPLLLIGKPRRCACSAAIDAEEI
jgi:hypothetical protein